MKRIMNIFLAFFVVLFISVQRVNAVLNYSILIDSLQFDGKITLPENDNAGSIGWARNVGNFTMKVNQQLAFCANPVKDFVFGQDYKQVATFNSDNIIGHIYEWAKEDIKSNGKYAQIFIWALRSKFMGGYSQSEHAGGSTIDFTVSEDEFVKSTKTYYEANSSGSRIQYKWILKNVNYCNCLYSGDNIIIDEETGEQLTCTDNGLWDKSKPEHFEKLDNGTIRYYSSSDDEVYTYTKSERSAFKYDNCRDIAILPNESQKLQKYKEITANYTDIYGDQGTEYNLRKAYREINSTHAKTMALYAPINNEDAQPIIAPPQDELDPKSCSNYVSTMTDNHVSQADIEKFLKENHIDYKISEETGKILCYDKNKMCTEGRRKYLLVKKEKNPNFNPKIGNRWLYIYTPDPSSQNPEAPTCSCTEEASKYNKQAPGAQYQLNCKDFVEWYYKNIDPYAKDHPVMDCDEERTRDKRAKCSGDDCCGRGKYKCEELLKNNSYRNYSCKDISDDYITCKEENGKITKLVCETKCGPQIRPAICPGKDSTGGETILQMSDAVDANNNPDYQYCVKQGIGYQIEDQSVSSVEAVVQNDNKEVYCNIRCWESLELEYPAEPQPTGYLSPIEAGRKFWWGVQYDSVFARLYTKRVCWSDDIHYDVFENDWANNEENIKQKYAEYMAEVNYNQQTDVKKGEECCVGNKTHSVPGTSCEAPYHYSGGKCIHNKKAGEGCHPGATEINATTCEGPSPGETQVCDDDAKGNEYYLDEASYTYDGKTGKSNQVKKCAVSAPNASELHDSNEEAKRKSAVEAAIKNRVTIYDRILSCQSTSKINEKTMYSYGTTITLVDNNDLNLADKKVKNLTLKSNSYGSVSTEGNEQAGVSKWLACNTLPSGFNMNSGDPCEGKSGSGYNIPTYLQYKWTYNGGSNFTYTSEFYFIAKMDSDTVISIEHLDADEVTAHSLGLDYSMGTGIPTYIDKATGKFNIDIDVQNLGSMKEGKAHFTPLVEKGQDLYDFNAKEYACQYDLGNFICPPPCGGGDGLAIEYRLIEMASGDTKKIFPGKEGKGRNQGSNWASFIATNATKFKNITSIGVVYKKPMYSIELTPSTIGKIRESNKKYKDNNKDPYTSYKDENNQYKIQCIANLSDQQVAEQTCTSKYITKLIKEKVITGEYAIENETNRRNKLKAYKSCYVNNTNC